MKKFFAGKVQGVSATQLKASDLLGITLDKDTPVNVIAEATAGMKVVELLRNVLAESRACYSITSPFNHVKETVANVLQEKFMARINNLVEIVESTDNIENLDEYVEDGTISREVVDYIADIVAARKAERETPVMPVEPVVVEDGIKLSADQVLMMMGARGLVIGGTCKAAMGEGTVLGFKVGQAGTLVVMAVDGKQHTIMASKVQGNEVQVQTKNEEVSVSMKNNNQSVFESTPSLQFVAPVNAEAQAVVDQAVEATEVPWHEMTAEERAQAEEAKLQADLAKFAEATEENKASASALANSSAAQALKNLVPAKAQAQASAQSAGAPVVNKGSNATQNKTQNNGGNVQMANNNVQGRQGSVATGAFGGTQVSGRQSSAPSLVLGGGAVPAVGSAWEGVAPVMALPTVEFTGNNAGGGQDFVWYIAEAAKYEGQILDLATLAANGYANPNIGITGMKFCEPASVANFFNREVKVDDFMWVEVFFGTTSYEFMFSANKSSEFKPYIFSRNIVRKQTKGGTWYCEYTTSRRSDKLKVVIQQDGKIREARKAWNKEAREFQIVAEDAPFVVEVGGESWINSAPNYGIRIGQQVFVQLMVMFDEQQGLKAARESK